MHKKKRCFQKTGEKKTFVRKKPPLAAPIRRIPVTPWALQALLEREEPASASEAWKMVGKGWKRGGKWFLTATKIWFHRKPQWVFKTKCYYFVKLFRRSFAWLPNSNVEFWQEKTNSLDLRIIIASRGKIWANFIGRLGERHMPTFVWLNLFHVLNGKGKVSVCVKATKLCKPLHTKDLLYMYTLNMIYVVEMPSTSMAKEKKQAWIGRGRCILVRGFKHSDPSEAA